MRPAKKPKKKGPYPAITLRKSLKPGAVVILVSGKQQHRGARMVFVKLLESGHLLLAGPKSLNKLPLMPVLQNFVIGTSTKIPLTDAVKTQADKINFSMFKKLKEKKSKESGIFSDSADKVTHTDELLISFSIFLKSNQVFLNIFESSQSKITTMNTLKNTLMVFSPRLSPELTLKLRRRWTRL